MSYSFISGDDKARCPACNQVNWKLDHFGLDEKGLYALAYCSNAHLRHVDPVRIYFSGLETYVVVRQKSNE